MAFCMMNFASVNMLIICSISVALGHANHIRETIILNDLPELFSNEKLPNQAELSNPDCLSHIGCVDRLPGLPNPMKGLDVRTTFEIVNRDDKESVIPFESVEACQDQTGRCEVYPFDLGLMSSSNFSTDLRTIVIIPGYSSVTASNMLANLRLRWLDLEDVNVITVNWLRTSEDNSLTAILKSKVIAREILVFLYYLAAVKNVDLFDQAYSNKFSLVGHALGAHIAGFIGKDMNGRVGRITGLDPSGKYFDDYESRFRLDKLDARLVDVIHTSFGAGMFYGTEKALGHLDYYANDGYRQESCEHDTAECHQRFSIEIYDSLLEHANITKLSLGSSYDPRHRLFAVASDTFEDFHNGSSLVKRCPITSLLETDLYASDINNCVVPLDPVATSGEFRKELKDIYKINFDPGSLSQHKYYFHTKASEPYLNNHYFLKVRVSKAPEVADHPPSESQDGAHQSDTICDISVELTLRNREVSSYKLQSYRLLDRGDHYELVVPYLCEAQEAKNALAKMDTPVNYENITRATAATWPSLLKIFPVEIMIKGLTSEGYTKRGEEISFMEILFGFTSTHDDEPQDHSCNLNVETVIVQPLKELRRNLLATYSSQRQSGSLAEIIMLGKKDESPQIDLLHRQKTNGSGDETQRQNLREFYLDTIVIGLPDESIDNSYSKEEFYIIGEHADMKNETSSVSSLIWIIISLVTAAAVMVLVLALWFRVTPQDSLDDEKVLNLDAEVGNLDVEVGDLNVEAGHP